MNDNDKYYKDKIINFNGREERTQTGHSDRNYMETAFGIKEKTVLDSVSLLSFMKDIDKYYKHKKINLNDGKERTQTGQSDKDYLDTAFRVP